MMIHYILTEQEVPIPYRWHPNSFIHCNIYKPKKPKPEENYAVLTMLDHIDMCREWIGKSTPKRYPGFKRKRGYKTYSHYCERKGEPR